MSAALIWNLTRDNNSFMHKVERSARRGMVIFSSEPNNLMAVSTQKYSGLANDRTLNVSADAVTVASGTTIKPASSTKKTALTKATGKSAKKVAEVAKATRGDLVSAAVMRYKRLARGANIAAGKSNKRVKSTRRSSRK